MAGSRQSNMMGMVAGHCYYFLEDVYPRQTGRRPLKTPGLLQALLPADEDIRQQPPAPMANFPAPGVVPPPGAPPGTHQPLPNQQTSALPIIHEIVCRQLTSFEACDMCISALAHCSTIEGWLCLLRDLPATFSTAIWQISCKTSRP